MNDYIAHVKEDVAGQGVVAEIDADDFPPPPSEDMLRQLEEDFGRKAAVVGNGDQHGEKFFQFQGGKGAEGTSCPRWRRKGAWKNL